MKYYAKRIVIFRANVFTKLIINMNLKLGCTQNFIQQLTH